MYYMLLVDIKDFNALIGNKPFFDQPMKKKNNKKQKNKKPVINLLKCQEMMTTQLEIY